MHFAVPRCELFPMKYHLIMEVPPNRVNTGDNITASPQLTDLQLAQAIKFKLNYNSESVEEMAESISRDRQHFQLDKLHHLHQRRDLVELQRKYREELEQELSASIEEENRRSPASGRRSPSFVDLDTSRDTYASSDDSSFDGESEFDGDSEEEYDEDFTVVNPKTYVTRRQRRSTAVEAVVQDASPKEDRRSRKQGKKVVSIPLEKYVAPAGEDPTNVSWGEGLVSRFANNVEVLSRKQSHCHACNSSRSITISTCT